MVFIVRSHVLADLLGLPETTGYVQMCVYALCMYKVNKLTCVNDRKII